ARFAEAMATVSGMLLGRDPGPLPDDPAIARCATNPVPLVSAAMSAAACRRAAAAGVGLLFDSLTTVARCRELAAVYRDAGGEGPVVLIRRAAPGAPSAQRQEDQLKLYRSYAAAGAIEHWGEDQLASGDAAAIAETLAAQADAVGADCLNLRVHAPGVTPGEVRAHIEALAEVRDLLGGNWSAASGGTRPAR
ncbi:MAG TPA: hypothetical protein VHE56_02740, partial [Mycobacteriales bacterium]|nr:hypothetical protein [Mycobacteriales bacterium]